MFESLIRRAGWLRWSSGRGSRNDAELGKVGATGEDPDELDGVDGLRFAVADAVRHQASVDEMAAGLRRVPPQPPVLDFLGVLLSLPDEADIDLARPVLTSVGA